MSFLEVDRDQQNRVRGNFIGLSIEHCSIIGETLFITSSPHLGAFYNIEKNVVLLILNRLPISLNSVKLNHLYNAEKILFVDKRIRNGWVGG